MSRNNKKSSNPDSIAPKKTAQASSMGYFVPSTHTKQELYQLYNEWNAKLADESFPDIEHMTKDGFFTPMFKAAPGKKMSSVTSATMGKRFNQGQLEYYHMISVMSLHHNWPRMQQHKPRISGKFAQWLLERTSEGLTVDEILRLARSFNYKKEPRSYRGNTNFKVGLKRSYVYLVQKLLLQDLFEWHRSHPEGIWYAEEEATSSPDVDSDFSDDSEAE